MFCNDSNNNFIYEQIKRMLNFGNFWCHSVQNLSSLCICICVYGYCSLLLCL